MLTTTDAADRVKELKTAAATLLAENQEIARTVKTEEIDGPDGKKIPVPVIDAERKERFDANMAQLREIQAEVKRFEELGGFEGWASASTGQTANAANAAAAGITNEGPVRAKSVAQLLFESEEYKAYKDAPRSFGSEARLDVKSLYATKDVYTDLPTGDPTRFGQIFRDALVPLAHRTFRVRSLFPVVRTTANQIEFFRVTGFGSGASTGPAGMVAERDGAAFALKPQSNLSVEGVTALVRTIAHWESAHRNVLADEPQLQGIIENELLYGLQLTEDWQILNGDGTGENLLGILSTPGIQTYANTGAGGEAGPIDAIRHAITLAFLANYEATGIVLTPTTWEQFEVAKDNENRYLLFAVAGMPGSEPRLWRLPVVVTPAMPANTGLVGAFGLGATLYDREQATIRVADQHADYFLRNAVVILGEERAALATKRPESFVKITNLNDVTP
jgi:HK97 family phage major capsid protein